MRRSGAACVGQSNKASRSWLSAHKLQLMELRQLELFLAVVEYGSFTKAADARFISQPAVSQTVRDLEKELGVRLLTRLSSGAKPTEAGQAVAEHLRTALRAIDAACASASDRTGLQQGRLDLTALRTLAAAPVAGLIGAYRRRHPGITVNLAAPDDPAHVIQQLRSGAAEIAITEAGVLPREFIVQDLSSEALVVIASRDYELADPLPIEKLARLPVVATPLGTSSRAHLDEALAGVGRAPYVGVVTAQREAILPLVLTGAGVALVPESLADMARRLGATVRGVDPPLERQLVLVYNDRALSAAARAFITLVEERRT